MGRNSANFYPCSYWTHAARATIIGSSFFFFFALFCIDVFTETKILRQETYLRTSPCFDPATQEYSYQCFLRTSLASRQHPNVKKHVTRCEYFERFGVWLKRALVIWCATVRASLTRFAKLIRFLLFPYSRKTENWLYVSRVMRKGLVKVGVSSHLLCSIRVTSCAFVAVCERR